MTQIVLTGDYVKANAARSVPGAFWDSEEKAWVLRSPTPRAAAVALRLFPQLAGTYPELAQERDKLAQQVRPIDNATDFFEKYMVANGADLHEYFADQVQARLSAEGHSMYDFQLVDLTYLAAVLRKHGGAYNGWSRGLGKSLAGCALVDELDCKRVLVVCPNTAKRSVWEPEIQRFLPGHEVVVLRNSKAQRDKDLGFVRQLTAMGEPFVLVVHYEALDIIGKLRAAGRGWDTLGEWDMVIADEVHRIANPKTKMARALKKIPTKYKLALSGSIIMNHASELFSPLQWLFPDVYRSAWRDFNDRYLDYVDSGFSRVCVGVKIEKLEELRKELGVFMVVRNKEDELDLPERTEETRLVELSPAQRRAYDELQESCIAKLDSGEIVTASDGLVLLTRLRQVATGLDLLSGELADSSKQDLVVDLIKDNPDEAFTVFAWFRRSAEALAERLERDGIGTFMVHGGVGHDKRADYIKRFQAGEGRVFIGTIRTLGESVTLHRANNAVFIDQSFNPSENLQSADRIYRIGQKNAVTITRVVAKDTVDELRVLPILADKEQLRRLILGS